MSEQSLPNVAHEVPKFSELDLADWGRDPAQPTEIPKEAKDAPAEPAVEPPAEQAEQAEPDTDGELARTRGWVPKEEWKGAEERWVDARAFNDRYETVLPVVQRENKKLNEQLKQTQAELAEIKKQAGDWQTFQAEQAKSQRQLRIDTLKMERKSAIENNDTDTLMRVDDELFELRVAADKSPPAQKVTTQQVDPFVKQTLENFVTENQIFRDPKMGQILAEQATLMRASGSVLTGREFLDEAKERVERLYPERFRAAPQRRHAMAETGGNPSGSRTSGKTWSDLKPENRAALERFIQTTKGMTREEILKNAPADAFRS